ncbi:MAG: allantoinase AllB [Sandaracinaceae bacterium]|nr:allantoinase AllB [Sandaracinaceae bacterium]
MSPSRFALRSDRVLVDRALRPAVVVVEDARIADVLAPAAIDASSPLPVIDLEGVLLPGLVDSHVHMNEPGRTEWEGFETATAAAASGGVTTLVDMPLNCIPVTTSLAALDEKLAAVKDLLCVDVGFWGGVVPANSGSGTGGELAAMASRGMLGAKCFLCHSGIDDFPASREEHLRAAMPILRDAGIPLLVHAELELSATRAGVAVPACDSGDPAEYASYLASRPNAFEDEAIEMVIRLCRETRCHVHVVHLSSGTALPMIRAAKDEGLPFTVETCPHYLCLSAEEVPRGATQYKCAPPIREAANRELLWQGVREGVIDLVTSDHSPCTPHLKKPLLPTGEGGDFCGAWGGIASLSLGLPSVWTEAQRRELALTDVVRRMSEEPARLAGLGSTKGRIARGLDADLCVFDPDASFPVSEADLRFRHKVSPYLGRALRGRVTHTWLRGRVIFEDGTLRPGHGRALLSHD